MTSSLFRPSAETAKAVVSKILLYGPSGAGKTHFMMTAPHLALLDVETRARNFAVRKEFSFLHAECPDIADFALAVKEVRKGALECDTIGVDSGSAIYLKLVEEHTRKTDSGAYVTDWVTVNRRFLAALNFVFSVVGKNVIFTMHSATKLLRQGQDFRNAGEHLVGDERIRFGFDYAFKLEPHGDPARTPTDFIVEKSSSPNLHVGQKIPGLTWEKFRELTATRTLAGTQRPTSPSSTAAAAPAENSAPVEPPAPAAPAAPVDPARGVAVAVAEPITKDQHVAIVEAAARCGMANSELADLVANVTHRTPMLGSCSEAEAAIVLRALEKKAPRAGNGVR
jgi:AAA domain